MEDKLVLKNNVKKTRVEKGLSQQELADMVGVSRNTISSIETGQFRVHNPHKVHIYNPELKQVSSSSMNLDIATPRPPK